MSTHNEIIAKAIVRTSVIGERIVESASDALRLDVDSVNILRDIILRVAKQEMTTFIQEVNSTYFTTPGAGYQPVSIVDKHIIPPSKHPNEFETTKDTQVSSWGQFFSDLRNTNIITDPVETHPKKHKCSSSSRLDVLESRMKELEAEIAKLKQY